MIPKWWHRGNEMNRRVGDSQRTVSSLGKVFANTSREGSKKGEGLAGSRELNANGRSCSRGRRMDRCPDDAYTNGRCRGETGDRSSDR